MNLTRRQLIKSGGVLATAFFLPPGVRRAHAAGEKVLVAIFLRGGADPLNLVVPAFDPDYYLVRPDIAVAPNTELQLGAGDSHGFGFFPLCTEMKAMYDAGELLAIHLAGSTDPTRSHFDAQDFMESGTPGDKQTSTGWLDRAIAQIPGREVTQAVSFSSQLVRSYLGPEPVLVAQTLTSFDLRARNWRSEAETLLTSMYQSDPTPIGTTGLETFEAINTLLRAPTPPPSNGAQYPNGNTGNALRQAAGLIKNGIGTRTIYVNVTGGFDTHSNQLLGNTNDYRPLGQALAAFATDLGGLLDDVVLMVTTEFGRTARVNGAAGTDHGTGYAMLVLGGRVRGGRVLGSWPGLASSQLYQNRDLAATTDFRDVFQEVARAQFGISASLFPGYTPGAGVGVV